MIEFDCIQGIRVINILNRLNFEIIEKLPSSMVSTDLWGMNLANEYNHLSNRFGFGATLTS